MLFLAIRTLESLSQKFKDHSFFLPTSHPSYFPPLLLP
jgi:hypothetical protein